MAEKKQNPAWDVIVACLRGPVVAIIAGMFLLASIREPAVTAPAREPVVTAPAREPAVTAPAREPTVTAPAREPAATAPARESSTPRLTKFPPQPALELVREHPEILEYFDPNSKDDVYVRIEKLARYLSDSGLYLREAYIYFAWLTKQPLSEKRIAQRLEDLEYVKRRLVASDEFINIIQDNMVTAVVTDDPAFIGNRVNLRQAPIIGDNVLGKLEFDEKCQVFGRSDAIERINGKSAFWFLIRTEDGREGWVFGRLLYLSINLPE
jgi:hypothetical protein